MTKILNKTISFTQKVIFGSIICFVYIVLAIAIGFSIFSEDSKETTKTTNPKQCEKLSCSITH